DAVVEHALAVDDLVFLLVERRGIVLEELDQRTRLRALVKDLGLAFVYASARLHLDFLWVRGRNGSKPTLLCARAKALRGCLPVCSALQRCAQRRFQAHQPLSAAGWCIAASSRCRHILTASEAFDLCAIEKLETPRRRRNR